ncbi:GIY-YIG nuclease family protein [Luteolibacter flavescens]|uniref:GIY-YIG nuclease family protein n=1 Tax=Luteolibacter flavescens TaxID=1859460 RepID=A0ABT3FK47_9BACT|nr:GIY-YIG nuclease family protein [Luteolibacter flavescens]MCW1883594.1 GIY-YIG nuclease family protein [Luteolibacter flavescens]
MEKVANNRGNQRLLFRLEDPLTARFGSPFFAALPESPGVYFFTGDAERLLYIGQSANLRARLGSYRHVAPGRHPKRSLRLVAGIRRIEWELCDSPLHAIERERELLLERRPPFNRAGVWIGPPWWLSGEPGPGSLRLHLSRAPGEIGPLSTSFRYLLGPLARGVVRTMMPALPIHAYPHGLSRATVPLSLTLPLPDPALAWRLVSGFAGGDTGPLLGLLEALPVPASEALAEFWAEEAQSLTSYVYRQVPLPPASQAIPEVPPKIRLITADLF